MPLCFPCIPPALEVSQALSRLQRIVLRAEEMPAERRQNAWESLLKETKPTGTIFEAPRVAALFRAWGQQEENEFVFEAADRLENGTIGMHVLSHAAFAKYLSGLPGPLPSHRAAIEGHHQRATGVGQPARIILRDPFTRSGCTPSLASLRLAANALHETIHLLGPQEPLASEFCAFTYDASFRLFYGDADFYETILRLHPQAPDRFDLGLLAYIQNAYL